MGSKTKRTCFRCAIVLHALTIPVAAVLHIIHPFIHGTPLDSGALDVLLYNLTAASTAPREEITHGA